jgi:hypothetical protein
MSHWPVVVWLGGCTPFPRYAYLAETRLESATDTDGFSGDEIQRAEAVADGVAKDSGMVSGAAMPAGYLDADRKKSAWRTPPRRFLMSYDGKLRIGPPLVLTAELSEDGRTLYFSLSDPNRGDASPTFERIDALLQERVAAAFPGLAITHEPTVIGPIWSLPP